MTREMDELEKCMWFLAGTGWVYAHDAAMYRPNPDDERCRYGPSGLGRAAGRLPGIEGVGVFSDYTDAAAPVHFVADMFTAVVLAYLGDFSRWRGVPSARSYDTELFTWSHMVEPDRANDPGRHAGLHARLFVRAAGDLLGQVCVTRVDVRETTRGLLWIVDWQEPDDGKA